MLDVCGPTERTGKPRGADLLDGTVTLPLIIARDRGLDAPTRVTTPEEAAGLCDRIAATGALDAAREQALKYVQEAKEAVSELALSRDSRSALELVADGVVERYA